MPGVQHQPVPPQVGCVPLGAADGKAMTLTLIRKVFKYIPNIGDVMQQLSFTRAFFYSFFFLFFFSPISSLVHKHSSKLNFIKSKKGQKTKNLTGTSLPQRQFNICLLVSVFSVLYMGKIKTPQKPFCKHSLQAFQTLLHKDLVTINIYK